jgi:hypothetical protein
MISALPQRRRTRRLVRGALACAALLWVSCAAAQTNLATAVKATFLTRFGAYVQWPARTFASASSPLFLCVAGEDPFGEALDKAARSVPVNSHPIVVRRLKTVGPEAGCHIVYIAGSEAQHPAQALAALRGSPALTVTDGGAGAAAGMINFVLREDRVRFEIDDGAATASGLDISSKLLNLAVSVKSGNP